MDPGSVSLGTGTQLAPPQSALIVSISGTASKENALSKSASSVISFAPESLTEKSIRSSSLNLYSGFRFRQPSITAAYFSYQPLLKKMHFVGSDPRRLPSNTNDMAGQPP